MFTTPNVLTAAGFVLLMGAANAVPAAAVTPPALEIRAEATDLWVSVDKTGLPSTVTPVVTVSDATATTVSAIPIELTATLLTRTEYGELTTSTGTTPAEPTATNKKGAGSFLVCSNTKGDYAPFCEPAKSSTLYVGTTYYVTWDSSAVNATHVNVKGTYINTTTGETGDDAFTSDDIRNSWSYYAWTPSKKYLSKGNGKAVNVTLTLNALGTDDETVTNSYPGPTVLVSKAPTYHQSSPTLPSGAALYIGLPVIFGFCLIMICGVCMWNRKTRKISVGNIMSRGRHGYGIAKSRAKRMTMRGSRKKEAIRLMDNLPEDQVYRDNPRKADTHRDYDFGNDAAIGIAHGNSRRDSDGLGSLAGTPTSEQFPRDQRQQGGNAFRDEMERQRRERY